MATKESALAIVRKIHGSIGHKEEKTTHQNIGENYANIPQNIVVDYMKVCERCV